MSRAQVDHRRFWRTRSPQADGCQTEFFLVSFVPGRIA
jgi:hypothetical protein